MFKKLLQSKNIENTIPSETGISSAHWFILLDIDNIVGSSFKSIRKIEETVTDYPELFDYLFQSKIKEFDEIINEYRRLFAFISQRKICVLLLLKNKNITDAINETPFQDRGRAIWSLSDFIGDYELEIDMPGRFEPEKCGNYNFVLTDTPDQEILFSLYAAKFQPHEIIQITGKDDLQNLLDEKFSAFFFKQYNFVRHQINSLNEKIVNFKMETKSFTNAQMDKLDNVRESVLEMSIVILEKFEAYRENTANKLASVTKDISISSDKYNFKSAGKKYTSILQDRIADVYDDSLNSFCSDLTYELSSRVMTTMNLAGDCGSVTASLSNGCDDALFIIQQQLARYEPMEVEEEPLASFANAAINLSSFAKFIASTILNLPNLIIIGIGMFLLGLSSFLLSFNFILKCEAVLAVIFLLINLSRYRNILKIRELKLSANAMDSWHQRNGFQYFYGELKKQLDQEIDNARRPLADCAGFIDGELGRYRDARVNLLGDLNELCEIIQNLNKAINKTDEIN